MLDFPIGLEKQQEQLPIQFIMEKIWGGASVVLTGMIKGEFLKTMSRLLTMLFSNECDICRFFIWREPGSTLWRYSVQSEPGSLLRLAGEEPALRNVWPAGHIAAQN